ncbi:TonB family protein [Pseudoxanthomonas sp. 10H]|uniref:TonB family protein n=1 Tax=Pseudoxanthomonas sp. 10H TaxID=3242729 RepID=UPI003557F63D
MWMPGWILALAFQSITLAGTTGGDVQRLVMIAGGGDKVVPVADVDSPPWPQQTAIEWPSDDLYRRGQGGTVILRLVIDKHGMPARVAIERSSGVDLLDLTALAAAAAGWRYTPATAKGRDVASEALQPVTFEIPPHYALGRTTGRTRDAWFERRRSGQAARPPADARGFVPDVVDDDCPIGVETIDQAAAMLERHGFRTRDPSADAAALHVLRDEEGYSEWVLSPPLPDDTRVLVRRRMVGDAERSWMVQSMLCEGPPQRCTAVRERIARGGARRQRMGGPYPVPPSAGAVP